MGAIVARGTKVKLKFSDGSTCQWMPTQDETLDYALGKVQELAQAFDPNSSISRTEEADL